MEIPQKELQYLSQTLEKLRRELERRTKGHEELERDLYEKRRYLWQELIGSARAVQDSYERTAQESDIHEGEKAEDSSKMQLSILKRMLEVPYFARIDFREQGDRFPESVYIGRFGFTDLETFTPVVCDWRSEIASMYYNYTPGPAQYTCPEGVVKGELELKRQFQIERGRLLGCFDTTLSIEDQFLQRILAARAGESMKTIVDSIQKSQDQIIRDRDSSIVLLLGCAGSGKTSIALHRLAFLLYRSRNAISASDCMIFSPNGLFSDYIDSVLPDLGEESVWQTTFADFASSIFGKQYDVQSYLEMVAGGETPYLEQKGTLAFASAIRGACDRFERAVRFSDITFANQTFFTSQELAERFVHNRRSLSYIKSVNRLRNEVLHRLDLDKEGIRRRIADELVERHGFRSFLSQKDLKITARAEAIRRTQELEQRFDDACQPDCFQVYAGLLEREFGSGERAAFEARLARGEIWFEDSAPLLYMMVQFGLLDVQGKMRHIVVDEAQDYSELQLLLLLKMYPYACFTILGDPKQALVGGGEAFWNTAAEQSGRSFRKYMLDVNYRSSKEIVEFTNRLAGEELCRAIDRSGGPVIHRTLPERELAPAVSAFLDEGEPDELRAVVCADEAACRRIFAALGRDDCCLLTQEFSVRNRPVCILPVYLAKGLEFDRVAVVGGADMTGGKLYVACTRALHRLALFEPEG